MTVHGYAVHEAKGRLSPFTYEPGAIGAGEVELTVTHCGICHSDIHLIDNDWGVSTYPFIPGHEAVGIVRRTGSEVRHVKPGDRAGIGWQSGSCQVCEWCGAAEENFCVRQEATCVGRHGGYADSVRADGRFVIPIPDGLDSAAAAPLLCGGVTVYSPMRLYGVEPHMRTAVVGLGGLGHLAIRFLSAFGCSVTVFSTSESKRAEAMALGADDFVSTRDIKALDSRRRTFDFILSTVPAVLDWMAFLQALRPKGRLCLVAVPGEPVSFPGFLFIDGSKTVCGSNIGSPATIREMLEFCARHGIAAQTESFPAAQVNEALDHVRANRARYRAVLTL